LSCSTWDVRAVSRCLVLAPCFDLQTKVCALLHLLLALVRPASAAFSPPIWGARCPAGSRSLGERSRRALGPRALLHLLLALVRPASAAFSPPIWGVRCPAGSRSLGERSRRALGPRKNPLGPPLLAGLDSGARSPRPPPRLWVPCLPHDALAPYASSQGTVGPIPHNLAVAPICPSHIAP